MTSSTLSPPLDAAGQRTPARPAQPVGAEPVRRRFDGLIWTCRSGFERLLAVVPARAWMDPAGQGWQRVKDNARREVWRAVLQGVPYYLKYYFGNGWQSTVQGLFRPPSCTAEWQGSLFALRAGIPAIGPAAYTLDLQRGGRRCALLVTEAVEPAQPLNEFWHQLQSDEDVARRRGDTAQLGELLAEMIARAHQAGFEHLDMHVANILVQPLAPRRYRTVFVDLHSARRGVPISDRAVVRNLAQLNQWFRKYSPVTDRLRFLRAYLRWRNEFEHAFEHGRALGLTFEHLVAALNARARRHAGRLGAQRDRRIVRDGRYFTRLKLPGGWRGMAITRCKQATEDSRASQLVFNRKWWQAQLANPLRWFNDHSPPAKEPRTSVRAAVGAREEPQASARAVPSGQAARVCKDSHSALVGRALLEHEAAPLPVIVKRPLARNWRRRIAQWISTSRSLRGWRIGHALLHRDVPTARPLAVLERRAGPVLLDSVLITEALPGALDLEAFLRQQYAAQSPTGWARLKRELSALLVRHVRRLQERGFEHRDCKASNILVVQYPRLKLLWIDLDGIHHAGPRGPSRQLRPLVRLHVSLLDIPGLTRADRVRFLKGYFARFGAAPDAWRAVWPALADAAAQKTCAKAARRLWKLKHYGRD